MKDGKGKKRARVIDVIPIIKGMTRESLSYFTTEKVAVGNFVKVEIRNKEVGAIVTRILDAKEEKTRLKKERFSLKKLSKREVVKTSIPQAFMRAVYKTALFYASSGGAILSLLLPKVITEEPKTFFNPANPKLESKIRESLSKEITLLQMDSEERYGHYRALVRQCFARGKSIMFIVPTHEEMLRSKDLLSRGIEDFTFTFSLKMKKSEMRENWNQAKEKKHPILFVTTPSGLAFSRSDIETMILERENSRAYTTLSRPFINIKIFLKYLAHESKRQLVFGDSVLSIETLKKEKEEEYGELSPLRWRLSTIPTTLEDASDTLKEDGKFEIFSPELKTLLEEVVSNEKSIFLFGARKGLSPTTVCGDCGFLLPCLNCGSPVVLHNKKSDKLEDANTNPLNNIYICHACGIRRDARTKCDFCQSWKLVPLGIGTETIAHRIRELFPNQEIMILDKTHASTEVRARSIAKKFEKNGGILIGTEMALTFVEKADYTAIVSLDALFSIPDFSIHERIFYLASHIREMARTRCIVQTRNIGRQILSWAVQGNIIDFYQNEITERKSLLYPPFSIFIKVSIIIQERDSKREREYMSKTFTQWEPEFIEKKALKAGQINLSMIIRRPRTDWPEEDLVDKLSLLGPQFLIKVDPESIL
ncbi:MAG: hypothetical protein WDZ64_01140 [Parcubacteria group bacterium]